jgi:hypothetical protein
MYTIAQNGSIIRDSDGATIPIDGQNRDYLIYQSWVSAGHQPVPYSPPPPTQHDYVMAVQHLLDSTVQQRNYDDIATCATYAGDPDPTFNAEGTAAKAWRSQVWRACYQSLAAVQTNQLPQPTVVDFIASLPNINWPVA